MITSQRYVDGAGIDIRPAADLNPLCELLDARHIVEAKFPQAGQAPRGD